MTTCFQVNNNIYIHQTRICMFRRRLKMLTIDRAQTITILIIGLHKLDGWVRFNRQYSIRDWLQMELA